MNTIMNKKPNSVLCPNKEECGSCSWSHIPYNKQLQQKLSDINGSFSLKEVDLECREIIPSPVTEHYRNRMDFVIDFEGRVGLRQKGKWWKVLDNHTCFIADVRIEELFHTVRRWTSEVQLTFFDRKTHRGLLRYAVVRTTTTGEAMVIIVTSAPADPVEERQAHEVLRLLSLSMSEHSKHSTLIWSINHTIADVSFGDELRTVSGTGWIEEEMNGFRYRITPTAFFQTNPFTAAILQQTVVDFVGNLSSKTVLDLYCGSGFFTVPIAQTAQKTIGVEMVSEAIVDARINAELNDVQIEFHDAKTEEFDWRVVGADVVILDPPRSGMHDKALRDLMDGQPETIVYVSCNYKNFAREMVQLKELYDVQQMKAIDMFPHTPHVELVTHLQKRVPSLFSL